ncbi:hypothetical protein EDB80DRAFT_706716 [Ilyonectria destructans]|nr:hypothetical protein EDB80DRAFT_706716 [Ilyonectria destructans]
MDPPICENLPTIILKLMPQQSEAKNEDEDWTGVTNTTERKKRQNRLRQRVYRMSPNPFVLSGLRKEHTRTTVLWVSETCKRNTSNKSNSFHQAVILWNM